MKRYSGTLLWFFTGAIILIYFGLSTGNFVYSFYFVSLFIPVVIGTSLVFNNYLIPEFLFKRRFFLFALYAIYAIIISVYAGMIIAFLALMLLSLYDPGSIKSVIGSYRMIPVLLYTIVLVSAFVKVVREYFRVIPSAAGDEKADWQITVRADRRNRKIDLSSILYIESMSDYVKIFIKGGEKVTTRETISNLATRLPARFLRIHRSFIVNTAEAESFTREQIRVAGTNLPISRTYKSEVLEYFRKGF